MKAIVFSVVVTIVTFTGMMELSGCAAKKIVAKDCSEAAQSGLYICSPIN